MTRARTLNFYRYFQFFPSYQAVLGERVSLAAAQPWAQDIDENTLSALNSCWAQCGFVGWLGSEVPQTELSSRNVCGNTHVLCLCCPPWQPQSHVLIYI